MPKNKTKDKYKLSLLKQERVRSGFARFHPPAREEVAAYCVQRGNAINPDRFYDHYEANGWKVGKAPMQDWRAAVRNWEQREQEFGARRETANERYSRELQELITAEDGTGGGGFDPWGGA